MKKLLIKTLMCLFLIISNEIISYSQNINTYVGTGVNGFSGDGSAATSAQIAMTCGVDIDSIGNLYIADQFNNRIRKVNTSGIISTICGTGASGFSGDGGPASSAQIGSPTGIAVDGIGNVYFCDYLNHRIRKISSTGTITTIAGIGVAGFSGDGSVATSAQINAPEGVAVDGSGNVYFADRANNRIRKISSIGTITTIAGTGVAGFSGDGSSATSAQINYPNDTEVDGAGNVYFVDAGNQRVRKISSVGTITTVAGTGVAGFSGDGSAATSAQLNGPSGIAIDGSGNLYIVEKFNNRLRKVNPSGIITTIAGTGVAGFSGDGGLATSATIDYPRRVAIAENGIIYFCDGSNYRIRIIQSTLGISSLSDNYNSLSVYPNPSTGLINIKVDTKLLGSIYTVYDNTGKVVLSGKIDNENSAIELGNLSGGIYFFSIGENLKQTFKVIKE